MKKSLLAFAALLALSQAALAFDPVPVKDIKAGFIYIGPTNDGGYTYMHEKGRQEMHQAFPGMPESSYVESVPEGPDAARTMEQLIRRGKCNLIFANSFGYMDYVVEEAQKHPEVIFMHCSGYKTAPNMGTYFGRMYQTRYLSGMVAGAMAKNDKIGFVAAFPIPEVIRAINAFTLGAQAINPKVEVNVVWIYSWLDPGKEKEAAKALIDSGCSVIGMHADSGATAQACEEAGVYVVGYDNDMSQFAPTKQLTAAMWNWGAVYTAVVKAVSEGKWTNEPIWWGLKDGAVKLAPMSKDVPDDVKAKVEAAKAKIISGEWDVFTGPLYDQKGELKLAEGERMSDADMLALQWFVKGVNGTISQQ